MDWFILIDEKYEFVEHDHVLKRRKNRIILYQNNCS